MFVFFSPSEQCQNSKTNVPIIGINEIKIHQPVRPISCNLLTDTAILGNKINNVKRFAKRLASKSNHPIDTCKSPSIKPKTILVNKINNIKYQYSDLLALPLKSKYLAKQILIAFTKPTFL